MPGKFRSAVPGGQRPTPAQPVGPPSPSGGGFWIDFQGNRQTGPIIQNGINMMTGQPATNVPPPAAGSIEEDDPFTGGGGILESTVEAEGLTNEEIQKELNQIAALNNYDPANVGVIGSRGEFTETLQDFGGGGGGAPVGPPSPQAQAASGVPANPTPPPSTTNTPIQGTFAKPGSAGARVFRTPSFSESRFTGAQFPRARSRADAIRIALGSGTTNPLVASGGGALSQLFRPREEDIPAALGQLVARGRR